MITSRVLLYSTCSHCVDCENHKFYLDAAGVRIHDLQVNGRTVYQLTGVFPLEPLLSKSLYYNFEVLKWNFTFYGIKYKYVRLERADERRH